MVPYPAKLDVQHELVEHVAWLLYEHRRARNTRWRRLGCFQKALLALVHLRKNKTSAQLGAGFGISESTAWRYVDETLVILSSWAPGLQEALTGLGEGDHVIVDGALIPTDRIKADEPYYSMKHRKHGMNVQVAAAPDGTPLWFSRATPGRTHDLTSAHAHGIVQACLTRRSSPGRPRLPGCRRHRPHPLLPPQRTARALPAVQPRPRPAASPRRTSLRPTQILAHHATSTLLHPPHQPHRPRHPRTTDLRLFRMKEVH